VEATVNPRSERGGSSPDSGVRNQGEISADDVAEVLRSIRNAPYRVHQHIVSPLPQGWRFTTEPDEAQRWHRCLCGFVVGSCPEEL